MRSFAIDEPRSSVRALYATLYWEYLRRILTMSSPYILGLSYFLNTFNTLSQLVHHTCTTFWLHLLNSEHSRLRQPSLHFCTTIPPPQPTIIALVWLYARPEGVIALPKYCFSIAKAVVISLTKLVYMYYPKWWVFFFEDSVLQEQPCAPLKL